GGARVPSGCPLRTSPAKSVWLTTRRFERRRWGQGQEFNHQDTKTPRRSKLGVLCLGGYPKPVLMLHYAPRVGCGRVGRALPAVAFQGVPSSGSRKRSRPYQPATFHASISRTASANSI